MLSSQTKDPVTAAAMKNLQVGLSGGFNLEALLQVEPNELNRMIGSVGFHNNKTKYIKATALIIRDKFEGEIPDTIEGLISLPGVGPKMAYLTMSSAWGRDEGIGVDVHVHRITNLWVSACKSEKYAHELLSTLLVPTSPFPHAKYGRSYQGYVPKRTKMMWPSGALLSPLHVLF